MPNDLANTKSRDGCVLYGLHLTAVSVSKKQTDYCIMVQLRSRIHYSLITSFPHYSRRMLISLAIVVNKR
jgi:hypothetical protein